MINITNIFDELLKIIDKVRLTGNVSDLITINSNTYTFTTLKPENLEIEKFISFDNDQQAQIENIVGNLVTIKTYYDNVPIEGSFKRLDPFGSQDISVRIAAKYAIKGSDPITDDQKFPAIEIVRDKIRSKENMFNIESFEPIEILFINNTNKSWTGQERHENNYKDELIPLFNAFKVALLNHPAILNSSEIEFNKDYFDLASYDKSNKNAVNHFVDIIRVTVENLKLDTNYKCKN